MSGFGYLVKEGFKNIWNNRIMSLASVGVLISCLVLTGAASLFSMNISAIVDEVSASNVTTVYLKDEVSALQAAAIGRDIIKIDNVSDCVFYSKDEAIENYQKDLGEDVFEYLLGDGNPLPNAFKVSIEDISKYDETMKKIKKIEEVEEISSHKETAKTLTNMNNLITTMSIWIIAALGLISLFIISNTIRVTMYSRRFEISIMKSVGATNTFVRIPFVVEGMVIGLISSIISMFGLMLLYDVVSGIVESILHQTPIAFGEVSGSILLIFLGFGVGIGALGALFSISRYLKKEGNEILGW